MGLFLQTVLFPKGEESNCRTAVQAAAEYPEINVQPDSCRWHLYENGPAVLMNDGCIGYEALAEELSAELTSPVMLLFIYDDDYWGYFLCDNGVIIDQFHAYPEYFGSGNPPSNLGNAALIAQIFGVEHTAIEKYLLPWKEEKMEEYKLTPLEREVFAEMAKLNHTEPQAIYRTCHRAYPVYSFHYFADGRRPPLTDISPLIRLQGLTRVEIYQCNIHDLSPLAEIPTLENVTVSGGTDLLPCDLTPLKEMRSLCLRYDRCIVPKLGGMPKLANVSLSNIDNLEGLCGLEKLTHLNISDNHSLRDLSPLAGCPSLLYLSAVDTAISDLTPLAGHPSLREINLSGTLVTDVSPLATIPALEMIWLYGTAVEDVSCLASLPQLNDLNLRKTQVTDLSAFKGRENILGIERRKLGIKKAGKTAEEIKAAIEEVRERLGKLGVTPRPPIKRDAINVFQEKAGVKLPKEYVAFLTKIGDGFECKFDCFTYRFPPLSEVRFDAERVKKRFSHREAWIWEDDDNATDQKITAAIRNGQIELVDCGCGRSFNLIVCGGAKGEVWDVADVGIGPYGNGLDFLDWMKDFLDGKVIE